MKWMERRAKGLARITRSSAMRDLMVRGLASYQAEEPGYPEG